MKFVTVLVLSILVSALAACYVAKVAAGGVAADPEPVAAPVEVAGDDEAFPALEEGAAR